MSGTDRNFPRRPAQSWVGSQQLWQTLSSRRPLTLGPPLNCGMCPWNLAPVHLGESNTGNTWLRVDSKSQNTGIRTNFGVEFDLEKLKKDARKTISRKFWGRLGVKKDSPENLGGNKTGKRKKGKQISSKIWHVKIREFPKKIGKKVGKLERKLESWKESWKVGKKKIEQSNGNRNSGLWSLLRLKISGLGLWLQQCAPFKFIWRLWGTPQTFCLAPSGPGSGAIQVCTVSALWNLKKIKIHRKLGALNRNRFGRSLWPHTTLRTKRDSVQQAFCVVMCKLGIWFPVPSWLIWAHS